MSGSWGMRTPQETSCSFGVFDSSFDPADPLDSCVSFHFVTGTATVNFDIPAWDSVVLVMTTRSSSWLTDEYFVTIDER